MSPAAIWSLPVGLNDMNRPTKRPFVARFMTGTIRSATATKAVMPTATRLRSVLHRASAMQATPPAITELYTPPRENVKAHCPVSQSETDSAATLRRAPCGFSISRNAASAPSPSTADTWFGP